jgi:glutaredoxin
MTWLAPPLIAGLVAWRAGWLSGLVMLVAGALFQVMYVRAFPRLSRILGYGSVDDRPATDAVMPAHLPQVTLYTASVCPFCPIVRNRLTALQQRQSFELNEIDVTFRPEIVRAKGIRSVPVIEVNGRTLIGNATSAQLADLLRTS